MSSEYDFILDQICWSFSSLETFRTCPKKFLLTYILKKQQNRNAFSDYGSYVHKLLERYFKGELLEFELADEYTNHYNDNVIDNFPPSRGEKRLYDSYFDSGLEYFNNVEQIEKILDTYEIKGIEHQHYFDIDKYKFTGVLDLELYNKNGWYEIGDHKSKGRKDKLRVANKYIDDYVTLTDGRLIPFDLIIQQYIYCKPFYETYKQFPKYLNLNMFRINDWYQVEFNQNDYKKSIDWAMETINSVYKETEWRTNQNQSSFFCEWLCGCPEYCEFSSKYIEGC